MLYATSGQIFIFLEFIFLGGICYLTFKFFDYVLSKIKLKNENTKKFFQIILDVCTTIFFAFLFIFLNTITNYGELRLYAIIGFLLGIAVFYYFKILIKNKIKKNNKR